LRGSMGCRRCHSGMAGDSEWLWFPLNSKAQACSMILHLRALLAGAPFSRGEHVLLVVRACIDPACEASCVHNRLTERSSRPRRSGARAIRGLVETMEKERSCSLLQWRASGSRGRPLGIGLIQMGKVTSPRALTRAPSRAWCRFSGVETSPVVVSQRPAAAALGSGLPQPRSTAAGKALQRIGHSWRCVEGERGRLLLRRPL